MGPSIKDVQPPKVYDCKVSFLRALREVAPEIELFLENHGHYMKNFVIKLIFIQSCTFRHFTKKNCILKNMSETHFATFFAETLPNTTIIH